MSMVEAQMRGRKIWAFSIKRGVAAAQYSDYIEVNGEEYLLFDAIEWHERGDKYNRLLAMESAT